MNDLLKKIIVGALGGFVSAVLVDLDAWARTDEDSDFGVVQFDWTLAIKRWISGAVSGGMAAGGFAGLGG